MSVVTKHFDFEADLEKLLSEWSEIVNLGHFFIQITYNSQLNQYVLWYDDTITQIVLKRMKV